MTDEEIEQQIEASENRVSELEAEIKELDNKIINL